MSYDIEAPTRPATAAELPTDPPPALAPSSPVPGLPRAALSVERIDADLDSVELPPMLPGLPNTPYRNCAALICTIVWQAIVDRDHHWCAGAKFNGYLSLLGWDNAQILNAKRAVLQGHPRIVRYRGANFLSDGSLGISRDD